MPGIWEVIKWEVIKSLRRGTRSGTSTVAGGCNFALGDLLPFDHATVFYIRAVDDSSFKRSVITWA